MNACTKFEQFLLTGANQISESAVTFVGFHWPMLMARIARRLHAPNVIIVYENGIVEDRLTPIFPTSPSDLTAAENSPACAGSLEALYMWLGAGRAEMTILEAAIVDRFGNINTTAVGSYSRPKVRLPGSGGGTELGSLGRNLLLVSASTNKRSYPAQVDYITSPGYLGGREERKRLGYKPETGPKTLVNPSGLFQFDGSGEMYATALHAGVSRKEVKESFSWDMKVDDNLSILAEPGLDQLSVIREEIAHAKERLYIIPGN